MQRGLLYLFETPILMNSSDYNESEDVFSPNQDFCALELNLYSKSEYKKEYDYVSMLYVLYYFNHRYLPWLEDAESLTIAAKKSQWINNLAVSEAEYLLEFSNNSSLDSLFDILKHRFIVPYQTLEFDFSTCIDSFIRCQS
jgi:hypothetical protein